MNNERCTPSYHEALRTVWPADKLTHIGVQNFGDGHPAYELCNCKKCGSTLAKEIK